MAQVEQQENRTGGSGHGDLWAMRGRRESMILPRKPVADKSFDWAGMAALCYIAGAVAGHAGPHTFSGRGEIPHRR
jgi:hypothetical protein